MAERSSRRLRVALGVVATVALASLALNLYLARSLGEGFGRLHYSRIFPLGFEPKAGPQPAASCGRAVIGFFGDSRAQLWTQDGLDPALLVENFGHGGQTSAQLLAQLELLPPPHLSIAVVQVGINDLHPTGALPGLAPAIRAALAGNLRAIRDRLAERADLVVLTTLFPPAPVPWQRRWLWDARTPEYIRAANEVIRASAVPGRVVVFDAYELLGATGTIEPRFADRDFFLHVSPAAYGALNAALRGIIGSAPRPAPSCTDSGAAAASPDGR